MSDPCGPCLSAEGGAGACSILANRTARLRWTQAGGATIAFLENDRRDLPGADERDGDLGLVSVGNPARPLCHSPTHERRARVRARRTQIRGPEGLMPSGGVENLAARRGSSHPRGSTGLGHDIRAGISRPAVSGQDKTTIHAQGRPVRAAAS